MNSALLVTQTEYARHRGVGKSAVSNWKARGLLVLAEDGLGRTLVDRDRTDALVNEAIDPARGRPATNSEALKPGISPALPGPTPVWTLGEVRTDLIREQRIGHKLRNARDAGELVAKAEYEGRIAELGRLCRERVHSVVRAHAERLAAEHDPRVITALLTAEIDQAFAELADQAEAGAFAATEDEIPEAADIEPAGAELEDAAALA